MLVDNIEDVAKEINDHLDLIAAGRATDRPKIYIISAEEEPEDVLKALRYQDYLLFRKWIIYENRFVLRFKNGLPRDLNDICDHREAPYSFPIIIYAERSDKLKALCSTNPNWEAALDKVTVRTLRRI